MAERARVAIEANLKRVELLTAQRLARHACWDAQYLLTPASAGPRLYWRPAKDSVATAGLWAAHKLERAEWKVRMGASGTGIGPLPLHCSRVKAGRFQL